MYTLVVGFLVCLSAEPPHHRNENLNSDLNQLLEEVIREMDRLMDISCYLYIKVSFSKCVRLLSFSLFYFSILLLEVVETTFFFFSPLWSKSFCVCGRRKMTKDESLSLC